MQKLALISVILLAATAIEGAWRPVVLMHGLTDEAKSMENPKKWIQADFPGIYVANIEIGNGASSSLFQHFPTQVDEFARKVQADPNLRNGFNVIGHSQGGLIVRGYVEKFNNPQVYNMITWAAPHGGQYGVPEMAELDFLAKIFSELMAGNLTDVVQFGFSFATYWRDPLHYQRYLNVSHWIADFNNERPTKNPQYKANILKLNAFMMQYSTIDRIIIPATSGIFQNFKVNDSKTVVPLKESAFYTEDWLGIRTLDQTGRLFQGKTDCKHENFPADVCKNWYVQFTRPFLNNTL